MRKGNIKLIVGIALAVAILLMGITIYAKFFGDATDSINAFQSCDGGMTILAGNPSFCARGPECKTYAPEMTATENFKKRYPTYKEDGGRWISGGPTGCDPVDKKPQYCCIQAPNAGSAKIETTETPAPSAATNQPTQADPPANPPLPSGQTANG